MLILFDIDGTILRSERAGVKAMTDAGRELFGDHFTLDGLEISGMLDTLIWAAAASKADVENTADNLGAFRTRYHDCLRARLDRFPTARLLPGIADLVARLGRIEGVTLGLLTGNFPETGRLKIAAAGLDPDLFAIGAWGCDGPTRRDLPPVALVGYQRLRGAAIDPARVVIIGDTHHDIDCARANGCRSLAVATGMFTLDDLNRHEPDHAVEDCSDVEEVSAWILNGTTSMAGTNR